MSTLWVPKARDVELREGTRAMELLGSNYEFQSLVLGIR